MNVNRGVARAASGVPVIPPPPHPLCKVVVLCPYNSGGQNLRIRRINMQQIFSSARLLLTPFAGPKICSGPCSCYVELN